VISLAFVRNFDVVWAIERIVNVFRPEFMAVICMNLVPTSLYSHYRHSRVTPYSQCILTAHEPQAHCVGQYSASLGCQSKCGWGRGSSACVVTLWAASGVGFPTGATLCGRLQYVQTCCGGPPRLQWVLGGSFLRGTVSGT
jgi:hypothetical protein